MPRWQNVKRKKERIVRAEVEAAELKKKEEVAECKKKEEKS